jgi:hypothetical protein
MMAEHQGTIERSYKSFWELPVPVVLVLLWLAGVVLLSLGAAALFYLLQAVVYVSEKTSSRRFGE